MKNWTRRLLDRLAHRLGYIRLPEPPRMLLVWNLPGGGYAWVTFVHENKNGIAATNRVEETVSWAVRNDADVTYQ